MKIQNISLSQLPNFLQSDLFKKSVHLPITSHRALSHTRNPRAQADDVVLIIAVEAEQIVGYIGLLPDELQQQNTQQRVAWLSCWWVQEGTGHLGFQLFLKAYKVWKKQMVITDFTPHIKSIIEKTRLFHFAPTIYGTRGFMRFNAAEVLPQKKAIFKKLQPLLKAGDSIANLLNLGRLQIWKWRQTPPKYKLQVLKRIDAPTADFITQQQFSAIFRVEADTLNWMLDHPWVLQESPSIPEQIRAEAKRYYFSSLSPIFQYYPIQVFYRQQLVAFLFLLNRDGHFKLPYVFLKKEHLKMAMAALFDFLYQKKAVTFTVFHPEWVEFSQYTSPPFFYKRSISKDVAIGKGLDKKLLEKKIVLQDGNGDYGFT